MRVLRIALFTIIGLLAGCSSYPDYQTDFNNLPASYDRRTGRAALQDEAIEIKARDALNNDPDIPYRSHININAYNGTLLVTGEAPDPGMHQKIIAYIRIIPGVKRVLDEIQIAPATGQGSHYNDSTITNRIKTEFDKIHQPIEFKSQNIKVVTENGHVYLMGLVYREEADSATKAAQQVDGVKEITKFFEYLRQ